MQEENNCTGINYTGMTAELRQRRTESLKAKFRKIAIDLTDKQADQFLIFYKLLIEKNKVMNLTAITEYEEVEQKHFIDSCICLNKYIINGGEGKRLIDVGTGAGFPGIPLKIICPEMEIILLDSLNKRLLFLQDVISTLGLEKITTVHYRAEDGARDKALREQFDIAVARAVANLSTLSEYCIPYVRKNGMFVAFKSGSVEEEVAASKKAIGILGGEIQEVINGTLPDSDINRSLILIKKERNTSPKYPRKAGTPSKQPL